MSKKLVTISEDDYILAVCESMEELEEYCKDDPSVIILATTLIACFIRKRLFSEGDE